MKKQHLLKFTVQDGNKTKVIQVPVINIDSVKEFPQQDSKLFTLKYTCGYEIIATEIPAVIAENITLWK